MSFQHYATPTAPLRASQVQNEPFFSGPDTTVFVHGWNMQDDPSNDWKAVFAETMYKRLYWQGYRGEFVSFDWPTFSDDEGPDWPIFGEGANITYNPSDFQAYRSAQALQNILENYRNPSDLQPVHLLAHSMGNIVAGEALRQWFADPNTVDPLVTNYIAMQAAVSAGAYKDNATDSAFPGRPVPDLYRFFQHGRNGLTEPGLGNESYFQGNSFSWENSLNYYNEQDFALNLWDINNVGKEFDTQSTVWPFTYDYEAGDGGNTNTDIHTRVDPRPNPDVETILDLALPNGRPGPNAYEILAFYSQSATLALGTKPVNAFDENFDLESLGLLGGSDIRVNHSYQFYHDAAETWGFYTQLKDDLGFNATYSVPAIVTAVTAAAGPLLENNGTRLSWFLEPMTVATFVERPEQREPFQAGPPMFLTPKRTANVDAVFEQYATEPTFSFRSAGKQMPSERELPASLATIVESLERLERAI